MRYARIAVALAVLIVVFVCTFAHVPIGTLCALCPVGFAEISVASGSVPWVLLPGVLVMLVVVFLLGRVFCSWICPTSLLRNIFGGRKPRGLTGQTGTCSGCSAADLADAGSSSETLAEPCSECGVADSAVASSPLQASTDASSASAMSQASTDTSSECSTPNPNRFRVRNNLAAQGIVLAVLLVVSLIVHFPVFCLFCPIGLVFGSLFAVSRLFITWQPGWELIVFPALLLAEVFLLRKWCSAICPLGFFFGLMAKARSRLGFLPRVRVNKGTCIHGEGCEVCTTTCPEDICAPTADRSVLEDCTLCLDCKEHCPTCSITLSLDKK